MSDLRHDPINDQWVAIAGNRQERPMEFVPIAKTQPGETCPFCQGNENETPPALALYGPTGHPMIESDDSSTWMARVIPNKYPSFSVMSDSASGGVLAGNSCESRNDLPGLGHCKIETRAGIQELIIPSPRHLTSICELSQTELRCAFRAAQDRIRTARDSNLVKHAMWFMNCRQDAGASLEHIHMQLIGSPVIGGQLRNRSKRNVIHQSEHGCSVLESLVKNEIEQGLRVVRSTENFDVICPFASRFAYQVFIVPRKHQTDFLDCPPELRNELAVLCQGLVARLETILENPGYNILLQTDPFPEQAIGGGNPQPQSGIWYLEIFPRITRAAGFEWGTDIWVNPIAPEMAAKQLRESQTG